MRSHTFVFTVLVWTALIIPAFAQLALFIDDADRAEFAAHRAALRAKLGEELFVAFGGYYGSDAPRWRQTDNFYYLTGVEIPNAVLLMDGKTGEEILFLPPARSGRAAIYDGTTIGPGPQAVKEFGVAASLPLTDLEKEVRARLAGRTRIAIGESLTQRIPDLPWAQDEGRGARIGAWLKSLGAGLTVADVTPILAELRRIKSPWEIARIEEATRVAFLGHVAAMQATKPGMMEYSIEAAATGAFVAAGCLAPAYTAIVGSGPNNHVLHYALSSRQARDGELVLMDYAPEWRYYCSDITRTWPVNGKFTEKQRKVYEDCRAVQAILIEAVKPGATFTDINNLCREEFVKRGYAKETLLHGVSHYIGLNVHDVGDQLLPFAPGCVLTIEPGVYFVDEGWGIRIEDMVLVTGSGSRVLGPGSPRTADEVEAVMASSPRTRGAEQ